MKISIFVTFLLLFAIEASSQGRFTYFNNEFKTVRERRAVYFTNEHFEAKGEEELLLRAMKPGNQDWLVTFEDGEPVGSMPFDPGKTPRKHKIKNSNGEELTFTSEDFLLPLDSVSSINTYLQEYVKKYEELRPIKEGYRVFVTFVITEEGKVQHVEILKGEYPALNKEVIQKINEKEQCIPKYDYGKPVASRVVIPFHFILENDSSSVSGTEKD